MSEYARTKNRASGDIPCFLSPHYLTDPEDSHLNTNARIPTSPYQHHNKFDDIQSLPLTPPPLTQHLQHLQHIQQQYSPNTNYKNTSKTLLKLSQSYNNTPTISPIPETPKKHNHNWQLQQTRNNCKSNNNNINLQQTQYVNHKIQKQKRRASQPHVQMYPTMHMSYEPFAISPESKSPDSPINFNYTKRELNEIRMKHYNQIYQTKKAQKQYKNMYTHSDKSDYNYKTRRHSMGNNNILIPSKKSSIIQRRNTCNSHTKKCIKTHTKNSNKHNISTSTSNTPNNKKQDDKKIRKTSTTTISRRSRKSQSQTNKQFKNYEKKIQIKKLKHKIQRCKSYDTSYDDASVSIYSEDQEIKSDLSIKTPKQKQKQKTRKKCKKKISENEFWTRDKYESDALNKQILRVRHGNGERQGQRVVTFSRRKSLFDGSGGKLIGLESPISTSENSSMDLEKKVLQLDEEMAKIKEKEKEYEKLKKQYENEYVEKCRTLQLKENKCAEKQAILLQNEVENDVNKEKILRREKLIHKQQHEFATETEKFDCVVSDFYFYQKTVNAMCNRHILLMNKWMEMAQNLAHNIKKIAGKILKWNINIVSNADINDINDIKIGEINDFEEISKLQNELENIPRPQISKQQSMECEMRLQDKWRHYLSIRFEDEYINTLSETESDHDSLSDTNTQDSIELLDEKEIIVNEKEVIQNIMTLDINNECKENENDLNNNNSFIRNKQHRRSSAFIKTTTFLDNLNPFWSLQYDSQEEMDEMDEIEEMDLSLNSNSSAVIQSVDDIEDIENIDDNNVI